MINPYVTTEQERIRKAFVAADAHALALTSIALANQADALSACAWRTKDVLDTAKIQSQLDLVRRRCGVVRTGVQNIVELASTNINGAEAMIQSAQTLVAEVETELTFASFEVAFATGS